MNINNTNLSKPSYPAPVVPRKIEQELELLPKDTVHLRSNRAVGKEDNLGAMFEKAVQGKADKLADAIFSSKAGKKDGAIIIGALPSALARTTGSAADVLNSIGDTISANTTERVLNVEKAMDSHPESALKTGLAVAGSLVSGAIGVSLDVLAGAMDFSSTISDFGANTLINTVDNLEGTKRKSILDSKSLAVKSDKFVDKALKDIQKEGGAVAGTLLGAIGAVGGAAIESVAGVMDTGSLVYQRMNDRAVVDGVGYKYEKKQAYAEYEASDKKLKDKIHLFATRLKQNASKIMDLRAGDILRIGHNIASLPSTLLINTIRNLATLF